MDNPEEMDKLLKTYNLPRLNQEDTDNQKRRIACNKIESILKTLPINKSLGKNGFTVEFYETFKEKNNVYPS